VPGLSTPVDPVAARFAKKNKLTVKRSRAATLKVFAAPWKGKILKDQSFTIKKTEETPRRGVFLLVHIIMAESSQSEIPAEYENGAVEFLGCKIDLSCGP